MGTTRKHSTNLNLLDTGLRYHRRTLRCNHCICLNNQLAGFRINNIFRRITAGHTVLQAFYHFFSIHESIDPHTRNFAHTFAAVRLADNQILGYIDQSTGQIT